MSDGWMILLGLAFHACLWGGLIVLLFANALTGIGLLIAALIFGLGIHGSSAAKW